MTTQREPDTSAEGLRKRRLELARVLDGFPFFPLTEVQAEALVAGSDALRALADAAGQAAPVPPPVEGLDVLQAAISAQCVRPEVPRATVLVLEAASRTIIAEHDRAEGLAKEVANLTRMLTVTGDERDHLAKEVQRLKDAAATAAKTFHDNQWQQLKEAEAKLAVYEAPIGDDGLVRQLRDRERFTLEGPRYLAQLCEAAADEIVRLSAAHAECKGENTKLREALTKIAEHRDRMGAFHHCQEIARAALAPASEEKAT